MWVAFLKLILSLAGSVATLLEQKQLIDAGAAKAILKGVRDADDAIDRAKRARARADSVSVDTDPFNRDISDNDK